MGEDRAGHHGSKLNARINDLYRISELLAVAEIVVEAFGPVIEIAARSLPLQSAILVETKDGLAKTTIWSCHEGSAEDVDAAVAHVDSDDVDPRFIVIPLVIAERVPVGVLQLETNAPLGEIDLAFANTIANQLAMKLDRDRAWRKDINRRERAEAGRVRAEVSGATSERGRVIAERSSQKYEALAAENARLYTQAQLAVGVREQILAIVSHDLRNPLGAILMGTAALTKRMGPTPDKQYTVILDRIQRSADRMLRLIEDLLDFASVEAGVLSIDRKSEDGGELIDEAIASFESVSLEKGLRFEAQRDASARKVYCDRDRILQVLSNLIGNPIKASAEGEEIRLAIAARGDELVFSVSDSGPGIHERDLERLFDRYWRADEARYRGTGLGLAISRGIVSAHGGRIWAESVFGKGAMFSFTVPLVS